MTKRKLFLLILIFVFYEVLVWIGSLLFLSAELSLLVGFVLTVCGLTVLLVYALVAKLSRAAHAPAVAPTPETPAATPSTASSGPSPVAGLIQEANEQLAKSPTLASQRVKSTITDFPLYFVLGAGGSGKTSLFLASKSEPELLAGQVNRDSVVVPTRLGNIWFADSAIVVEGAGDFFSGEESRWKDFLASFHRPGGKSRFAKIFGANTETKLSGVVLCCDAGAFVGVPDSNRLAALGRLAQQRLRVIGEVFGRDFPVYVIFTKSDSIPYFAEYFGRLTESEDSQVLGCTFPNAAASQSPTNETITAGLNKLYLSLADQRLELLEREKDSAKRPGIYEFPREFKRLRGPLAQFLVDVFRANPLQPNPRLLGVYFTGTRKVVGQAADLDRSAIHKVGDVTRILRADDLQRLRSQPPDSRDREPEITRWSFVQDVWRQILQRRQAAGANVYISRQQQLYRKVACMAAIGASALASLLFINSYLRNHFLVRDIRSAAQQCEEVHEASGPSLQNLRGIEPLPGKIQELDQPNIWRRFGFNQRGALLDPAWRAYYTRFHQYFLDATVSRLEDEFSRLPSEQSSSYPYGSVFADLRTYRTITRSPNEKSCDPDSALVGRLMDNWRQNRPPDAEAERIAKDNFGFYAAGLKSQQIPDELQIPSKVDRIQRTVSYLSGFKGVEPQYQQIIEQVNREKPPARLADLLPNGKYRAVMRGPEEVLGAFTRPGGWDRVQELIDGAGGGNAGDSCVLGDTASRLSSLSAASDLKSQLRTMYITQYIRLWREFIEQAGVRAYSGCGDAAEKLQVLKEIDSPILAVLLLASQNTTFPKHVGSGFQQAGQAALKKTRGIGSLFRHKESAEGKATKALESLLGVGPTEDDITSTFQPAHEVFEKSPPNPDHWTDSRNSPYLDSLGNLHRDLMALDHGGKCDDTNLAANSQASTDLGKAEIIVEGLARTFDNKGVYAPVRALLESPLLGVGGLITTDPAEVTKRKITSAKNQLCSGLSALRTKYPFDVQGNDADLDQVRRVLAPKDSLFASLSQAVGDFGSVRSDGSWSQKPDAQIKLSDDFWAFLTKLTRISTALFSKGGDTAMRYTLSVKKTSAVERVTGPIDGEEISMSSKEYSWPVPASKQGISLRVVQTAGGDSAIGSYPGLWAIFRLLSSADHEGGSGVFHVVNTRAAGIGSIPQPIFLDRSPIILEVTRFPNDVQNAFDKDFFRVSCPTKPIFE